MLNYIENLKEEIIKNTQELIRIPGVGSTSNNINMPFGENANKALEYVLNLGKNLGFKVKNLDGYCGYIEFGEGEEKVPLDKIAERAKQYQPAPRVTYKMIQEYIEEKYGFKVHTAYIAEVKRNLGLPMYDAPNMVEELKQPRRHPTAEKVEAIKDALKHFGVI